MNGSNRLPTLAETIRSAEANIRRSAHQMAEQALACGRALIEAKALVPHGQWPAWLETNAGLSARTARRYMQLAKSGMKSATVADLGIRGAAESLARVRPEMPELEQHPICAVFPPMKDREMAYLCADIVARGLRDPIVMFEGQVLDGWQRYRACQRTGVSPHFTEFDGDWDSAVDYVWSMNVLRNHLSEEEYAAIEESVAKRAGFDTAQVEKWMAA